MAEGLRLVASGANPMALQRGLRKASVMLAAEVKAVAKPVDSDEDILNIAQIATGSEGMVRRRAPRQHLPRACLDLAWSLPRAWELA